MWGEFKDDNKADGSSREHIPSEIVKFFVMQAMQPDPFRPPAPTPSADKLEHLQDLDSQGLEIDDRVLHSIKLIQHIKDMKALIEAAKEQASILAESQIHSLPPAIDIPYQPVPPLKYNAANPFKYMEKQDSDFALGKGPPIPPVTKTTAKKMLSKSVAALLNHAGFDMAQQSVLSLLTDAAELYINKMVTGMRLAVDQGANVGATGFPDAITRVLTEMGVGSIHDLHNYYQDKIIMRHQQLHEQCRQLNIEYSDLALQVKPDVLHMDNITKLEEPDSVPEIHFPAMGEDGDELQTSLETGFQMLHSLEQEAQLHQMDSQDDSPSQEGYESTSRGKRKRL